LYYELMVPDFYASQELEKVEEAGKPVAWNFPQGTRDKIKELFDPCFIEWTFAAGQDFPKDEATEQEFRMPQKFFYRQSDNDAYFLTPHTKTAMPQGKHWKRANANITACIKLCHQAFSFDPKT